MRLVPSSVLLIFSLSSLASSSPNLDSTSTSSSNLDSTSTSSSTTNTSPPPNVVLIVADDLGWGDAPWHNPEVHAPRWRLLSLKHDGHWFTFDIYWLNLTTFVHSDSWRLQGVAWSSTRAMFSRCLIYVLMPHICPFWYTVTLFRPVKSRKDTSPQYQ